MTYNWAKLKTWVLTSSNLMTLKANISIYNPNTCSYNIAIPHPDNSSYISKPSKRYYYVYFICCKVLNDASFVKTKGS